MPAKKKSPSKNAQTENLYESLFNNVPSGIAVYEVSEGGKKFVFKDFNKAAEKMDGLKKNQVIGKNILEIFPGVEKMGLLKIFREVYKTGKEKHFKPARYDDGQKVFWRENFIYKLVTGEIVALYNDVSDLISINKDLEEKEENYRKLFEHSTDALMTLDSPDWKFSSGNSAALKLFKAKNEVEFTSLGPWNVSPEKQPDGESSVKKAQKMIQQAVKDGSSHFNWMHQKLSGEDFLAEVLLTSLKINGKQILQVTIRDISEQEKSKKLLEEKVKDLEKFNKLMVSRELKMIELKEALKKLAEETGRIKKNKDRREN